VDQLEFVGNVINGIGKHSELFIPGRPQLSDCPVDWPIKLFSGSLNVRISKYPDEFAARGLPPLVTSLDIASFEPQFTIARHLMHINALAATQAMPHRGNAQVWRASLITSNREVQCWVLRRFGSALKDQIELVSSISLRNELGLVRDREWPAVVRMFGRWRSSQE
jgi:CTP-dependent riboflavin kinase